jgi:hypothetical protein
MNNDIECRNDVRLDNHGVLVAGAWALDRINEHVEELSHQIELVECKIGHNESRLSEANEHVAHRADKINVAADSRLRAQIILERGVMTYLTFKEKTRGRKEREIMRT